MPIAIEPNKKFPVVLDSDKDKPLESRPTFYVLSQTMRGHLQTLDVLDKFHEPNATAAMLFEVTCEELKRVIVGWSNMGEMDFATTDIRDLLTYNEARELLRKVAYNIHLEPAEKKD